ncbi:unnamed protein product [Polarella glacialis]|uniref:Uncharacterized protein n=1 Tax=Polarella glacialis TaxID=89957 RepID=A0A813DAE4_POLGL|nr:unnamed protein product [Polarella glacialis]
MRPPSLEDECFINGVVYCCADVIGVPEVCVPISFQGPGGASQQQVSQDQGEKGDEKELGAGGAIAGAVAKAADSVHLGAPPEISVHNCAHIVGGIRAINEDSFKVSCLPPTGYRFPQSPIIPIRGFYQLKEPK